VGEKRARSRVLIALHLLLALYSISGVLSKLASRHPFMSVPFVLCYGGSLAILAVYAIGWQQIIKRMPLIAAYANRAVTLVWGIVWGVLFFGEGVTPLKLLGAAIVLAGVVLFSLSGDGEEGDHE
jgi:drug/metabolite transporter (DMT)-like permease